MRGAPLLVALFMTLGVLAGCIGDGDDVNLPKDTQIAMAETPLTGFLHDVSELDETIQVVDQVLEHFRIEAPDGITLDTWVVRPDTDEPVPVVVQVTPYYAGGAPIVNDPIEGKRHLMGRLAEELVPRGYAYALSSVRGTGNSGGCFTQGGPDEAKDTAAVIEHLAAQPWANGNVGLIGVSYPGTTPQDVWIEAPPALKTIVPISGISDFYKYNFVNGVHIDIQGFGFNTYYWALVGAAPFPLGAGGEPDPLGTADAIAGEPCAEQLEVQEGGVSSTVDGNKDAYWQVRDFAAELRADWDRNPERASVFYVHGLQDWNVKPHMMEDWLPLLQESGVPFKAWLGQWAHNWPQREDWWNTTMVAWFDQFLKDIDTGILDAPPVQVQDDMGVWRHEAVWPPQDVTWQTFYPHGNGGLDTAAGGTGSATYHDGWSLGGTGTGIEGEGFVEWVSEPLTENLTISGLPRFVANVSADARRAALILTLAERTPDGEDRAFNFAALSLNHAQDLASGDDDIRGKTIPVDLSFFPQDDVVLKGSRLVLKAAGNIVGGPGPSLLPPSTGARITIDLDGASLDLPIDGTLTPEAVQPCWEGQEKVDQEEQERACYLYAER